MQPDPAFETRTVAAQFEMRDDSTTGAPILEGYAATFGQPYNMGPFWEVIDKRAFDRTGVPRAGETRTANSRPLPDVRLLVDHDGQPLARTKSGTLDLFTDDKGLMVRATLDASDPDVQRLVPKMRRGDLDEMSFAFRLAGDGDDWDYSADKTTRTIREVSLAGGDVSVVTYPANPTTSVNLRSDGRQARALYVQQMGREIRSGRQVPVREMVKLRHEVDRLDAEARGLTANDTRSSLNEAVSEAYSGKGYAYVVDYDDTNVYFTLWSMDDNDEDTYQQAYTLAADGMASLTGDAQQVRPRTTWTPVNDPDGEDQTLTPEVEMVRSGRPLDVARRISAALDL